MHPSLASLIAQPIAHRGLHDGNQHTYENSRSAFEAACDGGYAIELDVQLSADNVAVVFHDETLDRLTDETGLVREFTALELAEMNLGQTACRIEPLSDILASFADRTPIVIELKDNGEHNDRLVRSVADAVRQHADRGSLSAMSFSHDIVTQMSRVAITCPIGLTAEGIGTRSHDEHRKAMDIGVSFVSYHVKALPNPFVREIRSAGMPVITWTVRTQEDVDLTRAHADQATFETIRL